MKKLILVYCYFFLGNLAYSTDSVPFQKENLKLPSYQVVLDAQLQCDDKDLKKLKWANKGVSLATKVWTLISDLQLKEEKRTRKKPFGKTRDFVLSYKVYSIFRCGEPTRAFHGKSGTLLNAMPFMMEGWKQLGTIDFRDDKLNDSDVSETDERPEVDFTVSDFIFDEPPKPGREGFSCFVKLEDFIRSPKAIDMDKLCKDESKSKRAATEKEIQRIRNLLKN